MAQEKMTVELTVEEMELLKKAREQKAKEEAELKQKAELDKYHASIDKCIAKAVKKAQRASDILKTTKSEVYDLFKDAIEKKEEILKVKSERRSNTFTNSEGTARVELGFRVNDNYDDTVNEGLEIVNQYIDSLVKDDDTKKLVGMIRALLNDRWKNGQLKAENVLRLRKEADNSDNEEFKRGVKIICDSYKPVRTKDYIRVEVKDETGAWTVVPLNCTNC